MRPFLAALLLSLCIAINAAPASLPSNTKGACVLVRAETPHAGPNSPIGTATGTGFFIEKDLILTCDHLTKIPMGNQMVEADNVAIEVKPGKFIAAKVVRRDLRHDLALLRISRPVTDVQPFKLAEFCATRGENVTIVGNFPEALRITKGQLLTQNIMEGFAMSSAKVRSGFSGGPIICSDGSIQGILSQRDDDNNSIFVRSDIVLELLRSYEKKVGRTLSCIPRAGQVDAVKAIAEAAKKSAAAAVSEAAKESARETGNAANELSSKKIDTAANRQRKAAGTKSAESDKTDINPDEPVASHSNEAVVVAVPVRRAAAVYTNNNLTPNAPKN